MKSMTGRPVTVGGPADEDGWVPVTVPLESVEDAHGAFLRLGTGVEMLEPVEPRHRIARTAAELAERYGNVAEPRGD